AAIAEVIERADGTTRFLAQHLPLSRGVFPSVRPPPHFGYVLHLLYMLGLGKEEDEFRFPELMCAFQETGRPHRNAGVLCGLLCRNLPGLSEPLDVAQLCRRLASPALMVELRLRMSLNEGPGWIHVLPPFEANGLRNLVRNSLTAFTLKELCQWLRHGCIPPSDAGEEVARAVPAGQPRTLRGVLAHLVQQRRL